MYDNDPLLLACSAGVFWAGESCLCCNRHRCYDRGRLGRVKIVTLGVGARAKEGKRAGEGEKKIFSSLFLPPTPLLLTRPIFSPRFEFQHALSRPKKTRALQATLLLTWLVVSPSMWHYPKSYLTTVVCEYNIFFLHTGCWERYTVQLPGFWNFCGLVWT